MGRLRAVQDRMHPLIVQARKDKAPDALQEPTTETGGGFLCAVSLKYTALYPGLPTSRTRWLLAGCCYQELLVCSCAALQPPSCPIVIGLLDLPCRDVIVVEGQQPDPASGAGTCQL